MKKAIIAVLILATMPFGVHAEDKEDGEQFSELPVMAYSRAVVHKVCVDGLIFLLVEGGWLVQAMGRDESGNIYSIRCE